MSQEILRGTHGVPKLVSTRRFWWFVAAVIVLLAGPQVALANKKAAALPPSLLAARTIYIDNQTTDGGLRNNAYLGLAKWGHLQVVDSADKADMVLILTGSAYVKPVSSARPMAAPPTPGSASTAASAGAAANGSALLPNGYEAAPDGFTRLTLIDGKTGATVWSDLSKTNNAQNAAHIVDGLREAFEQSSKTK
jgi:hypothetical protein